MLNLRWRKTKAFRGAPTLGVLALAACLSSLLTAFPGAAAAVFAAASAADELSEAAARTLETKIASIANPESRQPASYQPIVVTETEANSYLTYRGYEFLPPALHDPEIRIAPDHLTARAKVDFDELGEIGAKTDDWGARFLAMVFKGQQEVTATGKLETANGQGKVTLDSMTVGGTSIPAGFVNFMVQNYVEKEYKIDLSKPFDLPDHVTHIEVGTGRATFHRSRGK
jgi:hypothetical protein